ANCLHVDKNRVFIPNKTCAITVCQSYQVYRNPDDKGCEQEFASFTYDSE
ncbi:13415_t:CDS:1, partial [Gigaspora rosea]